MTGSGARPGRAGRGPIDPRLLRHARSSRGGVTALAVLGAGRAATAMLLAAALTMLVVSFTQPAQHGQPPRQVTAFALLGAAFAVRAALSWAEQLVAQRTAARVADELRGAVLQAALHRGPAWVARYGTGRLSAVLGGGLDALHPWFTGYLPALVLGVALPPLVVATMAVVDPASALVTLVTLPLVPVLGALIGWATRARARQRWSADARLAGHFLDVVRGLATLRLFGRAHRQVAVVREMTDQHRRATMRVLRVAFLSSTALELVGTLSVGLVAVGAGLRVAAGDLGLGPALLVILLAPEAYRPLREVAARYHAGAGAAAVIADVDEVLSGSPAPGRHPAAVAEAPGLTAEALRVRHPGRPVDALVLPALSVRAGEIVALRGPSGAGKTTALRVLAGLQPVRCGYLGVAGPPPLYLPQRPTLPHVRTVRQALQLDDTAAFAPGVGDAETAHLLRAVGLDVELAEAPGGLDAPLGEHGQGVSSGQRQRLALARLLRQARRAPVALLLDEPTAHLDPATESLVIAELRAAAAAGCAVLIVAHRPALLAAADRIVDVAPPDQPFDAAPPGPNLEVAPPEQHRDLAPPEQHRDLAPPGPAGAVDRPGAADHSRALPAAGGPVSDPEPPRWQRAAAAAAHRPAAAVLLGAASLLAGLVLTGASGWLLVRASSMPPVLSLSGAVVLVRAGAVARPLLRYLERLVSHEAAFARLGERRARVYADLVPRVPGAALNRRGALLTRIVEDVDARVDGLLRGRLPAAATGSTVGIAVAVAFLLLPAAGWTLLGGLMVSAVLAPALAARQAARLDAATGMARARLRDAIVETVDGLEELASRGDAAALSVPRRRSRILSRLQARAAGTAGAAVALADLGWGLAVAGTAVLLGDAVAGGQRAEIAAVLLLAVVALGEPVLALPDAAVARRRAGGAGTRLAALTEQPPAVRQSTDEPPADRLANDRHTTDRHTTARHTTARPAADRPEFVRPALPGGTDLDLRALVAGWDPHRAPALRGLDLRVPAGARVAVLGRSGSGKSTLAAVLARLLDPRAGSAEFSGTDLRTLPTDALRSGICLVGDDVDHVFASTVRENLRLARPGAHDDELREALARVQLSGWLAALPDGLDTWLGAGATTVSGGERRRLATARALLADPALLVLDEPTEGLDEATASVLMADLLGAAAGRSVLLLTHRADGLDLVDEVHELIGGRLRRAAVPGDGCRPQLAATAR